MYTATTYTVTAFSNTTCTATTYTTTTYIITQQRAEYNRFPYCVYTVGYYHGKGEQKRRPFVRSQGSRYWFGTELCSS